MVSYLRRFFWVVFLVSLIFLVGCSSQEDLDLDYNNVYVYKYSNFDYSEYVGGFVHNHSEDFYFIEYPVNFEEISLNEEYFLSRDHFGEAFAVSSWVIMNVSKAYFNQTPNFPGCDSLLLKNEDCFFLEPQHRNVLFRNTMEEFYVCGSFPSDFKEQDLAELVNQINDAITLEELEILCEKLK